MYKGERYTSIIDLSDGYKIPSSEDMMTLLNRAGLNTKIKTINRYQNDFCWLEHA